MVTELALPRDDAGGRVDVAGPLVLRDYALVADGLRGALVAADGGIAWLCFPGWSDEAMFASLLGGLGTFRVAPRGRFVPEGRYEAGTLIWRTRFVGEAGVVVARTALQYPGEPDRAVVLHRVEAEGAPAPIEMVLEPACDYGRRLLGAWSCRDGVWELGGERTSVRLTGAAAAAPEGHGGTRLVLRRLLEPGEELDLVVELCRGGLDGHRRVHAAKAWRATKAAWAQAVPRGEGTTAPADVRRACALLRGLTTPEGATMAAATTSLPEHDAGDRNYDYRYGWVRDTCYVGNAGAAVPGGEAILDDAVRWVAERLLQDGEHLMPAYLPDGRAVPDVDRLGLPGYPGGGQDVVGNRVRTQFQLDCFGEALVLFSHAAACDRLEADGWRAAQVAATAISRRLHGDDDYGIWETEPKRWTTSRLVGVAGLRAIATAKGAPPSLTASADVLANRLLDELGRTAVHRSGRWQRAVDDERVDAALLLGELRGALPHDDPRSVRTREAIKEELCEEGYVYRYLHRGSKLGEAEGAFLICNFWMSLACLGTRRLDEAARWFERARSSCGSPGLLSEEYDVRHHQLRGNLPQAFVHALLAEVACSPLWG